MLFFVTLRSFFLFHINTLISTIWRCQLQTWLGWSLLVEECFFLFSWKSRISILISCCLLNLQTKISKFDNLSLYLTLPCSRCTFLFFYFSYYMFSITSSTLLQHGKYFFCTKNHKVDNYIFYLYILVQALLSYN